MKSFRRKQSWYNSWRRNVIEKKPNNTPSNIYQNLKLFQSYYPKYHRSKEHILEELLTLPMLRLLSYKAQGCKNLLKPSKPCHVGIHWVLSDEYQYARVPVIFSGFLLYFVLAKLATISIGLIMNGSSAQHKNCSVEPTVKLIMTRNDGLHPS